MCLDESPHLRDSVSHLGGLQSAASIQPGAKTLRGGRICITLRPGDNAEIARKLAGHGNQPEAVCRTLHLPICCACDVIFRAELYDGRLDRLFNFSDSRGSEPAQ